MHADGDRVLTLGPGGAATSSGGASRAHFARLASLARERSTARTSMPRSRRPWPHRLLLGLLTTLLSASMTHASFANDDSKALSNAVLRVDVSVARREWNAPWKLLAPESMSGTAFVIAGNRLLTNAH